MLDTEKEDHLKYLLEEAWNYGFYANRNAGDIEDYEHAKKFSISILIKKAEKLIERC